MKNILTTSATVASLFCCSLAVNAATYKPAVAYDSAGMFDKSFGQAVHENGVAKYVKETGVKVREYVPSSDAQREQGLERLARKGYSPIVVVGFMYASPLQKVAAKYPDSQFIILDGVVDLPNVKSILFKEQEGAFLVGAIAAMKTKTHKVGFVGGMDIPLIRRFVCGYEQGVKFVDKNTDVFQNMTGSTNAAWADPARGSELAKSQFTKGADIVFAAAGGTGIGVYQAAKDEGKLAIGVDSNQNYIHPGVMLTSMVKRVGLATSMAFKSAEKGSFVPGMEVLGLKEGGVDWALDENNRSLITPEIEKSIAGIKAKIVSGEIKVYDYMANNNCNY